MNVAKKCRVMPDGTKAVMVFLLFTVHPETMLPNICFISMNGWDHYDCDVVDIWHQPEVIPYWDKAEDNALSLTWNIIKTRLFNMEY